MKKGWAAHGIPFAATGQILRREVLTLAGTRWQYTGGVHDPATIAPESYTLDHALPERPGIKDIQLDLYLDYASNLAPYPKFQACFGEFKAPLPAIWGKNDVFFIPPGAEAYRRDNPNATVRFLDTGHFALETHVDEIASAIHKLLARSAG